MKRSVTLATALAVALASGSLPTLALAKGLFTRASYNAPPQPTQAMPMQGQSMMPGKSMMSGRQMETLPTPPGAQAGGAMMHSQGEYYPGDDGGSPFVDDSNGSYGYGGGSYNGDSNYGGCDNGWTHGDCGTYGDNYGCGDCCYDSSYSSSSRWDCFDICGSGQQRHWFFTADYLSVRANFSQATAFVIHDDSGTPLEFHDVYHELDFDYDASYRIGGGYYLGCCDEQLRFLYTHMSSGADAFTDNPDALGPFETSPGPGGTLNVNAFVNSNSFDLEYAKTIPLGGNCCECGDACCDPCSGDPCGCGDACCAPACPAWDITWSGGLRFAEVNWTRRYLSNNPQTEFIRDTRSTMDFKGGGPRVGLEGRRYFGQKRWCSLYMKGDLSLLLGDLQFDITRVSSDGNPPDVTETQNAHFRNIIPVTEIEAGGTAQLSKNSRLSAGYLFSAWHDLGFRDQFNFSADGTSFLETSYDDANILGWDGVFARFEYCY